MIVLALIALAFFFYDLRAYLYDYQVGREEFSPYGALLYAIAAQPLYSHALLALWLVSAIGCFYATTITTPPSFW